MTRLSDSWDAQANRSCNRLSESLLAKIYCSLCIANSEAFVEQPRCPARHEGQFPPTSISSQYQSKGSRNARNYEGFAG